MEQKLSPIIGLTQYLKSKHEKDYPYYASDCQSIHKLNPCNFFSSPVTF